MANPLLSDREIAFQLKEVLDTEALLRLPAFSSHSAETFDLYLESARRVARDVLFPTYRLFDLEPPKVENGAVVVHERLHGCYRALVDLGIIAATRPADVNGGELPHTIATLANAYVMAANAGVTTYAVLTTGAAHLLESFGDETLKRTFMDKMYAGEWGGTMALTEPQAGSSLADVTTKAVPSTDGHYLLQGSKIFISAGDHDLTDNIVHLTLARIEGAPAGIKGVSLFAVPKKRLEGSALVDNDVAVAGAIHKIGWKAVPSLALNFGERGDCRGYLVGAPNRGIMQMFQMMNEARIAVGIQAVATSSVAYHESLAYARDRTQGRSLSNKDPAAPQVPIIEHADVRRMLLRQKAIVEGGLALVARAAYLADLAEHGANDVDKRAARVLLELLTPIVKSFPAEKGFESNALAVQILGGYGYSSEYLPEAWLRDQKLNSLHEGTTGIHAMDLLGRKVAAEEGAALKLVAQEIHATVARAAKAGVDEAWGKQLVTALDRTLALTRKLAKQGMGGDGEGMMRHAFHYLDLLSTLVVSWQWLSMAAIAQERVGAASSVDVAFYEGKRSAAQYWLATELPRVEQLAALIESGDDSYARTQDSWF